MCDRPVEDSHPGPAGPGVSLNFHQAQEIRDLLAFAGGFMEARADTHPGPGYVRRRAQRAMDLSKQLQQALAGDTAEPDALPPIQFGPFPW